MSKLLKEIHADVQSIGMNESNVKGEKRVVIMINGDSFTLSPKLSAMYRSGEVKPEELGDYIVRPVESEDGTTFNSLGLSGEDLSVSIAGWKSSGKVAKKIISSADFLKELESAI